MIHRLWYLSLVLEAALLCVMLRWCRHFPWFVAWLAFDVLTGGISVWVDLINPHGGVYQLPWTFKQPVAMALRWAAARESWHRLGGRQWSALGVLFAAFIGLTQLHQWPSGVVEFEFIGIAVIMASLGFILWASVNSALKLKTNPLEFRHAHVMVGYFILTALCYYVVIGYRQDIGKATGLVASLSYGSWIFVFAKRIG